LLFAFMGMALTAIAQDNDDMPETTPSQKESTIPIYHPLSIEAAGELCYPLTNYALRDNFGGVYSYHASIQGMLFKHFEGGIEFQNQQLSVASPIQLVVSTITTNEFFYDLGAKLSYYSNESNQWFFTASFVVGKTWIVFDNVQNAPRPQGGFKKQVFFLTPRISEGLRVDDNLRIGAEVDYTYFNYAFSPTYVGFTQSYTSEQTIKPTTMFSWGFYAVYLIGKAKS